MKGIKGVDIAFPLPQKYAEQNTTLRGNGFTA